MLPADAPRGPFIGVRHREYLWFEAPLALKDGEMLIVVEPDVPVTGHLEDDRGRPIHYAWLHVYDARPRAVQRAAWEAGYHPYAPPGAEPIYDRELAVTKTDLTGDWSLRLREGRVRMVMHLPGGAAVEHVMDVDATRENRWHLRLEEGRMLHVVVEPPPGADHLCFDVQLFTGHPDGRLDVQDGYRVNDPSEPDARTSDLDLPPPRTPYYVVLFCENEDVPCHVVGPLRGPRSELRVRLPDDAHRHGTLRGTLPEGSWKADLVAVVTDARGFEADLLLDEDGSFVATGLPPGRYTVRVETQDDTVLWRRAGLRVEADATTRVEGIRFALPAKDDDD